MMSTEKRMFNRYNKYRIVKLTKGYTVTRLNDNIDFLGTKQMPLFQYKSEAMVYKNKLNHKAKTFAEAKKVLQKFMKE